jgi:hypothetical protein
VFREEAGVSFVALGALKPKIARHLLRSAAYWTNALGRPLLDSSFLSVPPHFIYGHPTERPRNFDSNL